MAKKNHAIVVLDETGSMRGEERRVVTSLNEYVEQLPKGTRITVFKFDSLRWDVFFEGKRGKWQPMTEQDYSPGAMTPLYDAIGKAIAHAKTVADKGDRVMMMIDTDGIENASKEYDLEKVKDAVGKAKKDGWEFLFMAGGLDERAAKSVSVSASSIPGMKRMKGSHATRSMRYGAATAQTMAYFSGQAVDDSDDDESWRKSAMADSISQATSSSEQAAGDNRS